MASRKIFNFESVILVEETIKEFGYHPDIFGKTSSKFVLATCRFCGIAYQIRKGFFNKAGSACHKLCKIEEQKLNSPFKDPSVRKKVAQTNKERYGSESASHNKEIAQRISDGRNKPECKEKIKQTCLEKYGVENPFQSEEIKEKIKNIFIEKYGVDHPLKSKEIQEKYKDTIMNKYGVESLIHYKPFAESRQQSFAKHIKENTDGKYTLLNILRSEIFWEELSKNGITLTQVCKRFNIDYQKTAATLSRNEFKDRFRSIYSYPRCQKQQALIEFINEHKIEVDLNNKTVISPLELDVFIPSANLGIEFNGSYWHSEKCLEHNTARNKHINKTKLCREKGIRLIHIFEKTWDERKKQWIGFINSILGKNQIKINARDCVINNDIASHFIEDHHIQGHAAKTIKYFNLIHNNETVASMTASKHHRQNSDSNLIVLNRLCFKNNYSIRGGASKLFKSFVKWATNEKYSKIVSWSDNCWTDGKIYNVLGFQMQKEYTPDYFYWDMPNNKYYSKQSQMKSATNCPEGLTEREWCEKRGLFRIWDCGKRLWVYNLT